MNEFIMTHDDGYKDDDDDYPFSIFFGRKSIPIGNGKYSFYFCTFVPLGKFHSIRLPYFDYPYEKGPRYITKRCKVITPSTLNPEILNGNRSSRQ